MDVYILAENVDKKYFTQGPILGVYTFSALLGKLRKLTNDKPERIFLYDERCGDLAEWLAHNVSDCVWLSIDIEPEKSDKENMFNLFGIKVETKKYGVLGMKLKE